VDVNEEIRFMNKKALKRLVLHSDQSEALTLETDAKVLRSLSGKRMPRIGYIPSIPDPRRKYFQEKVRYYARAGFEEISYFDVEEDHSVKETEAFFKNDVIHLSGGDPVVFWRRLEASGSLPLLHAFVARGGVLLGVSAGAMLMTPSLGVTTLSRGGLCDESACLGLVEFEVIPHWSEHRVSAKAAERYALTKRVSLYGLSDGECIIVNGEKATLVGTPFYCSGQQTL